ncbi:DUF6233 domain-containing protein [Streptomyces sp. NPDC051896]|uniref:DUF6233 domain-containing protein n=1 Tax=Streptomyces sp. NPDC051896 TaxID=3155416 RepID=UPI003419BBFF
MGWLPVRWKHCDTQADEALDAPAPLAGCQGGCWNVGGRSRGVPREAALRALTDGVPACPHCGPDNELGHLD